MPVTKVEQDQFRWDNRSLIHMPTGATFSWKYPGSGSGEVTINWEDAGDLLPSGEEYDPSEIEAVATRLLREYRQGSA